MANQPGGLPIQSRTRYQPPTPNDALPPSLAVVLDAALANSYISPTAAAEAKRLNALLWNNFAADMRLNPDDYTRLSSQGVRRAPTIPAATPADFAVLLQEMTFGQQDRIIRVNISDGFYLTRQNVSPKVIKTEANQAGVLLGPNPGSNIPAAAGISANAINVSLLPPETALIIPGAGNPTVKAYNFSYSTVSAIIDYDIKKTVGNPPIKQEPGPKWKLGKVTAGSVKSRIYAITPQWLQQNNYQSVQELGQALYQEYENDVARGVRLDFDLHIENNVAYQNAKIALKVQRKFIREAFKAGPPIG